MKLIRKNIQKLKPYICARDIYKTGMFFDANESFKQWVEIDFTKLENLNRYPDSKSESLKTVLIDNYLNPSINNVDNEIKLTADNIFVGAGSDEIIDLIIRGFVEDEEKVMMMDPSYSVYEVQAEINSKKCTKILLNEDFSLDINSIQKEIDSTKVLFLCSPNNPTGNLISESEVTQILSFYKGILVIDEAYIEFAGLGNSFVKMIEKYPNLVILRTFSKAWGLAGIRVGYAIADKSIISTLEKIKDSYNVSLTSQEIAKQALEQVSKLEEVVNESKSNKMILESALTSIGVKVTQTRANFVLAKVPNASDVTRELASLGIVVRDRSSMPFLKDTIRITVGSKEENVKLINVLSKILCK